MKKPSEWRADDCPDWLPLRVALSVHLAREAGWHGRRPNS